MAAGAAASGPPRRASSAAAVASRGSSGGGGSDARVPRLSKPSAAAAAAAQSWEVASNGSASSRASRPGPASRASSASAKLTRRRSLSRAAAAPTAAPTAASAGEDLCVGDHCSNLVVARLRRGEDLSSEEITELPEGERLEVLAVSGRRLKVTNGTFEGWISSRTRLDEVLVVKCSRLSGRGLADPEVGARYEIRGRPVLLHAEASLKSEVKANIMPGTVVSVDELMPLDRYRARVSTSNATGWISLVDDDGKPAVGAPSARDLGSDGVVFVPKYLKIKSLLEAAVKGDLEAVQRVAEGEDGGSSPSACTPSLNSTDVRGKTALMYAAGLGHKLLVEYLLSKSEVDVNSFDDTQKTALHYAAKRGRKRRTDEQHSLVLSEIVFLLLQRGAQLDARDQNGCTALMFAAANGDEAVAKRLMLANAAINVRDFEGHSPLDYAWKFGENGIMDTLRSAGALRRRQTGSSGLSSNDDDEAASRPASPGTLAASGDVLKNGEKSKAESAGDQLSDSGWRPVTRKTRKVTKAKPGKRRSTATPAGMSEAAISQEAASQVAVETNPEEDDDDPRRRALGQLAALLASKPTSRELDMAIRAAAASGAEEADLSEARARWNELNARDMAREELRRAIKDRGVARLRAALAQAEAAKMVGMLLAEARRVLAEEEPRDLARASLHKVQESGTVEQLRSALREARRVGLSAAELRPYQELVRGAESREEAEGVLRAALEAHSAGGLKFAIRVARLNGVDAEMVKRASTILPKRQARELLTAACEKCTLATLQDAIRAAEEAPLEAGDPLLLEAREQLRREEVKERQLASVRQLLADLAAVDRTSIDSLRQAKDELSAAIQAAFSVGVTEAQLLEAETRRKRLHNAIEDIKGSIRVFCRIRPMSSKEKDQGDAQAVHATGSMSLKVEGGACFQFDAVFMPGTQEEVFEDCRDLVQSAVDGYNVTMFAYGQTGAGKTFTMYGSRRAEGTAPRTIREVFRVIEKDRSRFSYTVMGSMLELYRNDLVDLLCKRSRVSTLSTRKLAVKQDKLGSVVVEHLTEEECTSAEELRALLDRGAEQRSVAATALNSESSRSHLVFTITIVSVNRETKERLRGKIVICDLAGSERLKKSLATEDTQKEAIEINKSLTALGDVIAALTQGSKMVPYRNHKLTQLMQDSLGGTAKTLMFVNCAPSAYNAQETLMSLKYATRAKKITNMARKSSAAARTLSAGA